MSAIVSIAAGGALGAVMRFGIITAALRYAGAGFPYGTLIVNVIGSFLIGAMVTYAAEIWHPPENIRLFLIPGFLGGFTTFSTFSLDIVSLYERGAFILMGTYICASVLLSLIAILLAMALVKGLAS